jgi:hypothetical protein
MRRPLLAAVLLAWTWGCQSSNPTQPLPSPSPTAEPTAPPSSPPGAAAGCQLPPRPDHGNCHVDTPRFAGQVDQAYEEVIAQYPEIFDFSRTRGCDRCFGVVNGEAYHRLMAERLKAMGFCAQCDEECGVKNTNAFNEQYDIQLSNGYMRRLESGAYRATCTPAAF